MLIVYTLNLSTVVSGASPGAELWSISTENSTVSGPSPVLDENGRIVYVSEPQKIRSFEVSTGDPRWESEHEGHTLSGLSLGKEHLYFGNEAGRFYRLTAAGQKQWEFDAGASIQYNAVLGSGNTLFFAAGNKPFALDRSTGNQVLFSELSFPRPFGGPPVLGTDGFLYIGGEGYWAEDLGRNFTGTVYGIDSSTGNVAWRYQTAWMEGGYEGAGVIAEHMLLFPTLTLGDLGMSSWGYFDALELPSVSLASTPWPRFQGNNQSTGRVTFQGPTIEESLHAEDLSFHTSGDVPFFPQSEHSNKGPAAMQSGRVQNAEQSVLSVTLQGPGTLSFWWKVSSEPDADSLAVSIDGARRREISGQTDWTRVSLEMESGSQVLEWSYSKDASGAAGEDAGWIDAVQWLPREDSRLKWRTELGPVQPTSPALHPDGQLYLGTSDGYVYSLAQESGERLWQFFYDTRNKFAGHIHAAPVLIENKLIAGTNERIHEQGFLDDQLFGIDRGTGNLLWSKDWVSSGTVGPPAVDPEDRNFFLASSGFLDKRNTSDGARMYDTSLGGTITSTPPIIGPDRVYLGYIALNGEPQLGAAHKDSGEEAWVLDLPSPPRSGAVDTYHGEITGMALDETATLYAGDEKGILHAVNAFDGAIRWEFDSGSSVTTAPIVGESNLIYFGAQDHQLYAVDRSTGELQWKLDTGAALRSTPVAGADGTIYFGNNNGRLLAVDGKNGNVLWTYGVGDAIHTAPVLNDEGVLFFGANDGFVYALQTSSTGLADSAWPKYQHDVRNTGANTRSPRSQLRISVDGDQMTLRWEGEALLQSAPAITGPWTNTGQDSPATFRMEQTKFFRTIQPR